jgi:hypothetical protein
MSRIHGLELAKEVPGSGRSNQVKQMADEEQILIDVRGVAPFGGASPAEFRGNIDILVGDDLTTVGTFDGALILWPSLEALCDGIEQMRDGQTTIEIVLVGDTPSLWIITRRYRSGAVTTLTYRGHETRAILPAALDRACGQAIAEYVAQHPGEWNEQACKGVVSKATRLWLPRRSVCAAQKNSR